MSSKRILAFRIVLLTGLTIALSLIVNGQLAPELDGYGRWVNGVTEPWFFPEDLPKDARAEVQSKWLQLGLEATSHEEGGWTGDYFVGGDTHGDYLRLGRTGFVVFRVNKCAASVMGFTYGSVVQSSTLIQLLPQKAEHSSRSHRHDTQPATRYLPVTWRGAKYLVPENAIAAFGNYVAGLGEFNDVNSTLVEFAPFFQKSEIPGSEADVIDRFDASSPSQFVAPNFPPGYERFIKKPIEAQIIALGRPYIKHDPDNEWWNKLVLPVTISVGRDRDLKPKLVLRIVGVAAPGETELVSITRVNRRTASGVIERSVRKLPCVKFDKSDDCKDPEYAPVEVGWRLTTNPLAEK